jgi:L-cysteine/cystine lyase
MMVNLSWLEETIGWEWIYNRIIYLARYAYNALSRLSGVTVITPSGPQAGLISFNLDGYDPARVMTKLMQDNIILRFIPHPYVLRISTGFYNTEADIDRLIAALEAILTSDPESLPKYISPW